MMISNSAQEILPAILTNFIHLIDIFLQQLHIAFNNYLNDHGHYDLVGGNPAHGEGRLELGDH